MKSNASFVRLCFFALLFLGACKPSGVPQTTSTQFEYKTPKYDPSKKTVFVIADNDGTEMFDMMAPFYLFCATEKANVYIVAEKKSPVVVKRGLLVLPHFTFSEIDSLHMNADVMVVPNQSRGIRNQKKVTVKFIRNHYTGRNQILSVCDGSATVAATGIYDGKDLTTHSSDYEGLKKYFDKPSWVLGVSVTQSGNLFSTAGVANATEGSLTVINDLFGRATMQETLSGIHYPYVEIQKQHQNLVIADNIIYKGLRKGTIKKTEKVGVLLQNGVSEIDLAAILDTYYRSFPASLETFIANGKTVTSKYGLTLLATGDANSNTCTELHVLMPENISTTEEKLFSQAQLVKYNQREKQYMIDVCLKRINSLYGNDFANFVKLMLDYN
jgi:putative intracellular protease/amidase